MHHFPPGTTVLRTGLCSVVIPTSNRKNRLLRTIRSIQAQTYESLEIVVSNDGSTDGTPEAVNALNDPRIVLVSSDHRTGVSEARNRGIAAASGEFIAFCDDDDFWVSGKLAGQIGQLSKDRSDWAYCFEVVVDDLLRPLYEGRKLPGPDFMKQMSSGNPIPGGCSGVVARRRLLDDTGWFDPEFSMSADWELWVRFAAVSEPSVWPAAGVLYVMHPSQMTRDMRTVDEEFQRFLTKIESHRRVHGHLEVEPIYFWMGAKQWQSGRRLDAARMLMVDKTLRQRRAGARVLAVCVAKDLGLRRRHSFTSDAVAAVDAVRALLHHEDGVAIEQTPWPTPIGPEPSQTVAGWTDARSQMIGSGLDTAVIVCTYKRSDLLDRAVRRVFAQEGYDRQFVVVVDDGSADEGRTDAALAVLERDFADRLVVVRHDQNRGVATARTTGVRVAVEQGASIVCFHDDDDFWPPNRLALGAGPFQDPSTALTYGEQHRIDYSVHQTGEINVVWSSPSVGYRRAIFDGLMRGRVYLPFQTVMLRADLCSQLIPFKPVSQSEDVDFALRAMGLIHRSPNLDAVYVPHVLAYYVTSPDSLSQADENIRIREGMHREILAEHVPRRVVDVMFTLSNRILRPVGVRLGKARKLARPPA